MRSRRSGVDLAQPFEVWSDQAAFEEGPDGPLRQRVGIQVDNLLHLRQPFDHRSRGGDPADAEAREEHFRDGAEVDDAAVPVERMQRRQRSSLVAQRTYGSSSMIGT